MIQLRCIVTTQAECRGRDSSTGSTLGNIHETPVRLMSSAKDRHAAFPTVPVKTDER